VVDDESPGDCEGVGSKGGIIRAIWLGYCYSQPGFLGQLFCVLWGSSSKKREQLSLVLVDSILQMGGGLQVVPRNVHPRERTWSTFIVSK
jgi:hypothetical protein